MHTRMYVSENAAAKNDHIEESERDEMAHFLLWKLSKLIFGLSAMIFLKIIIIGSKVGKVAHFGISWIKLTTIKLISLLLFN